ncbi:hypothetical protein [Methylorubrum extorquens]|uniref:Uncharacterized protein n=1 Tax=Methylorubrum extorquens TaxID=408 RepID=A0AAX3WQZ7_METEX|nr:hypothetical protein [Methylorubrum extorquens]WHQ72509.1 hypothetical protein KEC54_13630 [Methylorubrum extorquens]
MKSSDAMIVWTPDRDPCVGLTRGQIRVVTLPQPDSARGFYKSVGACDDGWREMTDDERVNELVELKGMIVAEDNIPEATVHAALQAIDEYKARHP